MMFSVVWCVFAPHIVHAATAPVLASEQVNTIDQKLHQQHFSGSVLIVHNGQPIYIQSFGYANYQQRKRNQPQMLYQIGSMQKTLTAVLIMQQIQAHHLRLDDTLAKYYPRIPNSQQITIRMLLDMRSGLQLSTLPSRVLTPAQLLSFITRHVQVKDVGDFDYQDVNYAILAGILSQVTHQSYQSLFTKTFLTAYSPQQAGFFNTFMQQSNTTCGYANDGNAPVPNYALPIYETPQLASCELGAANTYFNVWTLYQLQRDICEGKFISLSALQQLRTGIQYPHDRYIGGIHNTGQYYWSHGLIAGFESAFVISFNGQNAVVTLGNRPLQKYMPTLARSIYHHYALTPRLQAGRPSALTFFDKVNWPAVAFLRPSLAVPTLTQQMIINNYCLY